MAQSTLSSIPPQVIESGQVSVDDITGTQFLLLRELGWEIAGALVFDPAKNGATRRSKGAASKAETPPQAPKPPPRTLRAPKKALKAPPTKPHSTHKKSKRSKKPPSKSAGNDRRVAVSLSADAMERLHGRDVFKLPPLGQPTQQLGKEPPLGKSNSGGQPRAGFVTFPDKDRVNWNDTSEDGEQWRR